MKQVANINKAQTNRINRSAYIIFLALVVYLFIKGDYDDAIANLGIAMVFDPFDSFVKWNDRPRYQRAWLIVHVTLVFAGVAFLIYRSFN